MANKIKLIYNCDCDVIHKNIVNQVKEKMPQEGTLKDLTQLFKIFGDSTRIKILWALDKAELCVCDIAYLLDMTQSAISHQLIVLKKARLVKNRKEGKIVFYSLDDEHINQIFNQGIVHIEENNKNIV